VISALFGNNFLKKKLEKKIIEDKRLQSLFLCEKKNCYEFALHQDLPSQSLAQELPKKELRKKKSFRSHT